MMNTQENKKNDKINSQADALTDLPVTDEQADRATGGGYDQLGRLTSVTDSGVSR